MCTCLIFEKLTIFSSFLSYSTIQVSDDEDDTHPNIDTPSLFRWRHQARVERMQELEREKQEVERKKKELEAKKKEAESKLTADERAKLELEKLTLEEQRVKDEEEESKKKERLQPWNVDTLSKPGFTKTVINKPKPKPDTSNLRFVTLSLINLFPHE